MIKNLTTSQKWKNHKCRHCKQKDYTPLFQHLEKGEHPIEKYEEHSPITKP
jgi:hypothetical protein